VTKVPNGSHGDALPADDTERRSVRKTLYGATPRARVIGDATLPDGQARHGVRPEHVHDGAGKQRYEQGEKYRADLRDSGSARPK
jgi:hypothetical protein